jgi:hypothetical protein
MRFTPLVWVSPKEEFDDPSWFHPVQRVRRCRRRPQHVEAMT